MKGRTLIILLSGILVACAQPQSPEATAQPEPASAPAAAVAPAQAPAQAASAEPMQADHFVNIQRATCDNLLKLSEEDRAAATMFYVGYQSSRVRATTINVSSIPSIQAQALAYCEENPRRTVAQAFAQAYSRTRR